MQCTPLALACPIFQGGSEMFVLWDNDGGCMTATGSVLKRFFGYCLHYIITSVRFFTRQDILIKGNIDM